MAKKIALILGGMSAEADVSRATGAAFAEAVQQLGHDYKKIEADQNLPKELIDYKPDVALLAVHGKLAEDGTVQSLCEFLKIPYSGSGVLASAACFDKAFCKSLYVQNGIPTPDYQLVNLKEKKASEIQLDLELPVVVKPSRDGSSVGISIIKDKKDLEGALVKAAELDHLILIEKCIIGKEVTVPVLGKKTLTSIEIAPKEDFYNYENKYTSGKTDYILPAKIKSETLALCEEYSLKACEALRVRAYARVDFMLDENEKPYILEVNTLPGCTPTSLVPQAAAHEGLEFKDFINYLIENATFDYEGLR